MHLSDFFAFLSCKTFGIFIPLLAQGLDSLNRDFIRGIIKGDFSKSKSWNTKGYSLEKEECYQFQAEKAHIENIWIRGRVRAPHDSRKCLKNLRARNVRRFWLGISQGEAYAHSRLRARVKVVIKINGPYVFFCFWYLFSFSSNLQTSNINFFPKTTVSLLDQPI